MLLLGLLLLTAGVMVLLGLRDEAREALPDRLRPLFPPSRAARGGPPGLLSVPSLIRLLERVERSGLLQHPRSRALRARLSHHARSVRAPFGSRRGTTGPPWRGRATVGRRPAPRGTTGRTAIGRATVPLSEPANPRHPRPTRPGPTRGDAGPSSTRAPRPGGTPRATPPPATPRADGQAD